MITVGGYDLIDQKVTNKYWKYPDLKKCIQYQSIEKMGGYEIDGIQAYVEKIFNNINK